MSLANVRRALVQGYLDTGITASSATAAENVLFNPPRSAKWCKLTFMPVSAEVATLGAGGRDRHDGLLQVALYYPVNTGEAAAAADYETLRAAFTAGARFAYGGSTAAVLACERTHGRESDGWWVVVSSVRFYAMLNR